MGTEGADGGSCTELTDLSATERPIRMVIRPEDPQKSKYHTHIYVKSANKRCSLGSRQELAAVPRVGSQGGLAVDPHKLSKRR